MSNKTVSMLEQELKEQRFFMAQLCRLVERIQKTAELSEGTNESADRLVGIVLEYLDTVTQMPELLVAHAVRCVRCGEAGESRTKYDAPLEGFAPLGTCARCGGVLRKDEAHSAGQPIDEG